MTTMLRTSPQERPAETLSPLQEQAQALINAGFQPVPMKGKHVPPGDTASTRYRAADFTSQIDGLQLRTGKQDSGYFLCAIDLDQHHAYQNAQARLTDIDRALSTGDLAEVRRVPTPNGGTHVLFLSPVAIPSQTIYDPDGRIAGELICVGGGQRCRIGDTLPEMLNVTGRERLISALYLRGAVTPIYGATDRKADIKAGLRLVNGYERVTTPDVRAFLVAGLKHRSEKLQKVAADLLDQFDTGEANRSIWHADFIQHAMFRASELGSSTTERYRRVMALAIKADALGKGNERDYNIVNDSAALIYRVSIGAPKDNGGRFVMPFWLKADAPQVQPETQPETQPDPEPAPRAPGRPVGDRSAKISTFLRILQRLAVDDMVSGYTLEYFADRLSVSRRSAQNYLRDMRDDGMLVSGQADKNGRLVIILKCSNGGASNYQKPTDQPAESPKVRGASADDAQRTTVQETAESAPNAIRKEDHQSLAPLPTSEPVAEPALSVAANDEPQCQPAERSPRSSSDAVGAQGSGDPQSSGMRTRRTLATPHGLSRGELTYKRAVELEQNSAAYERTEADDRRSAARATRYAPLTVADLELSNVLEFGRPEGPQTGPTLADLRAKARARMAALRAVGSVAAA